MEDREVRRLDIEMLPQQQPSRKTGNKREDRDKKLRQLKHTLKKNLRNSK